MYSISLHDLRKGIDLMKASQPFRATSLVAGRDTTKRRVVNKKKGRPQTRPPLHRMGEGVSVSSIINL